MTLEQLATRDVILRADRHDFSTVLVRQREPRPSGRLYEDSLSFERLIAFLSHSFRAPPEGRATHPIRQRLADLWASTRRSEPVVSARRHRVLGGSQQTEETQ